jgi:NAD(P)-dependent dehydrogenase (short-subunit alcohol dehydrogenase family)
LKEGEAMYNLNGKVAIVTGAGGKQGFGRAIANRLADEGADVVVVDKQQKPDRREDADLDWKGIDSVAEEIRAKGRKALAAACDITESEKVDSLIKNVLSNFGRIDILVNNAGVKISQDFLEITDEAWNLHLAVNLTGMFFCSRAAAREMVKSGKGGKIINIGSMWSKVGSKYDVPYCASKFGVIGLTQSMALQLAKYNIFVNAVCPALTDTGINSEEFSKMAQRDGISWEKARERMYSGAIKNIPLNRLGKSEDIANMVAFLASDESSYITGQSINVNGGAFTAL